MRNLGIHRWPQRVALAGVVPLLLAGCGGVSAPAPSSTSPPDLSAPSQRSAAPSSPGQQERQAVVAAYTQYWSRSPEIPHQPEDSWQEAMAAIAVDPQLSITLEAMRRNKRLGLTTYGDVTVRIVSVEIDGNTAKVVDCQDASDAGQADIASGDRKTAGVPRMPVHATLVRDDDQWKVSQLDFPGGEC